MIPSSASPDSPRSRAHARRAGLPSALLLACLAAAIGNAQLLGCTSSGSPLAASGDPPAGGRAGASAGGKAGNGGAATGGSSVSVGGTGGRAGSAAAAGGSAGVPSAGGGGSGGNEPPPFVEPPGPPELTFLNGLVDVPAARLCLVPMIDGVDAPGESLPRPMDKSLVYGESLPIDLAPLGTGAYHPFVVAGTEAALAGQTCATLTTAPPAAITVRPLPVLPAGTFAALRSLLLVATGCLTGAGTNDVKGMCGATATAPAGNASSILVEMSRVLPQGLLSMQLVHASRANEALHLSSFVPINGQISRLASNVAYGGVAPRPPFRGPRDALFGVVPAESSLQLDATNTTPLGSFVLAEALQRSGISLDEFADGAGFVFVLVGPRFTSNGMGGAPPVSPFPYPPRLVVLRAPATAL